VEPGEAAASLAKLTAIVDARPQTAGSVGARMEGAIEALAADGAAPVIVVGSDIPALGREEVEAALAVLQAGEQADLAFGPSVDGGYYLVGIGAEALRNDRYRALFDDDKVTWSTSNVLAESERVAAELGLRSARIATLSDVDTGADLARLRRELTAMPKSRAMHTRAALRALDGGELR
jgi:glycosyltransferase A (GT-A) superfamily protein (DUF2064 family)